MVHAVGRHCWLRWRWHRSPGAQDKGGKRAPHRRGQLQHRRGDQSPHQALTPRSRCGSSPLDNDVSSVSFELNNALNVSRVVDETGRQIPASRSSQDFTVRLSFPRPLTKGKPTTLTFTYDGRLTGQEESPVYGIKFAAIQNDFAYLMYPARWFPVNDYTIDRYTGEPAHHRAVRL